MTDLDVLGGDRVVEVGIDELLLLTLQRHEPSGLLREHVLTRREVGVELVDRGDARLRKFFLREVAFAVPLEQHGMLDLLDTDVGQVAAAAAGVPSEAEEVLVLSALAAGLAVAHPSVAASALQRALERVIELPGPVAGDASPGEEILTVEPGLVIDERFVRALEDGALVDDLSDVVRVLQEPMHLCGVQRRTDVLGGFTAAKSSLLERIADVRDAPVAGGVHGIRPLDVRGTVEVDHDAAHLLAIDARRGVQIAERCDTVCTAASSLLRHALFRLCREIRRVVLGEAGKDRMHELAARGLVDEFRHRHERCAGRLDRHHDRHVIGAITGQTVELVHDDVVDVGARVVEIGQHALQGRAVS